MALNDDYSEMIDKYQRKEINLFEFRAFMIQHISHTDEFKNAVLRFQEITKEEGLVGAYAFSFAMLFWYQFNSDIDKALEYNKKGEELYQNVPNFENEPGYIDIIYNYLLAYNAQDDLQKAYDYSQNAYLLSKKSNYSYIMIPFANCYSYMLSKIGLNSQAIINFKENLSELANCPDSVVFSTYNFLIICLLKDHHYEEARKYIDEVVARDLKITNAKQYLILRLLLEYYIAKDDRINAIKTFDKMENMSSAINIITLDDKINVTLTYAHYFRYVGNTELAATAYDFAEKNIRNYFGSKADAYSEMASFFASIDQYKKAYELDIKADNFYKLYLRIVSQNSSINDFVKSAENENYRTLYHNIRKLSTVINNLNPLATTIEISQIISRDMRDVLGAVSCELFFANPDTDVQHLSVYHNERNSVFDFNKIEDKIYDFVIVRHKYLLVDTNKFELAKTYEGVTGDFSLLVPICDNDNRLLGVLWVTSNVSFIHQNRESSLLPFIINYIRKALVTFDKYTNAVSVATIDYLTQVYNRHGLVKRLKDINENNDKYDLVVFDIDDFKGINDNYGHPAGDEILKDVAYLLSIYFRNENVARFGGDEFIVLSTLSRHELIYLLELFKTDITSKRYSSDNRQFRITVSAGVARCTKNITYEDSLRLADKLLYQSKRNGKDDIFYDDVND